MIITPMLMLRGHHRLFILEMDTNYRMILIIIIHHPTSVIPILMDLMENLMHCTPLTFLP